MELKMIVVIRVLVDNLNAGKELNFHNIQSMIPRNQNHK